MAFGSVKSVRSVAEETSSRHFAWPIRHTKAHHMRVLNTQQMRDADRQTIDDVGIPSIVLMENAGRQAVAAMEAAFEDLAASKVGVLCGRGNNGGDGFVVARALVQRGGADAGFLVGSVGDVRRDARTRLG